MRNTTSTGIVCQWCERVIQGGGESLTLVTCLRCSSTFASTLRRLKALPRAAAPAEGRRLAAS